MFGKKGGFTFGRGKIGSGPWNPGNHDRTKEVTNNGKASNHDFRPMDTGYISPSDIKRALAQTLNGENRWNLNYNLLDMTGRSTYKAIERAVRNGLPKLTVANVGKDVNYYMEVLDSLIRDDPSLFFVNTAIRVVQSGARCEIRFDYNRFLNQRTILQEQLISVGKKIITETIKGHNLPYEVELAIHDYLIKNTVYDRSDPEAAHSLIGPLLYGKGCCEGISEAFCFLANSSGLSTSMISGILDGESHRWNIVEIDGKRYHLDVTSDLSGIHGYFNCSDQMIKRSHHFNADVRCNYEDLHYHVVNRSRFQDEKRALEFIGKRASQGIDDMEVMIDSAPEPNNFIRYITRSLNRSAGITCTDNIYYRIKLK